MAGLNEMKPGQELTYAFLSSKLRGVENFFKKETRNDMTCETCFNISGVGRSR